MKVSYVNQPVLIWFLANNTRHHDGPGLRPSAPCAETEPAATVSPVGPPLVDPHCAERTGG